MGFSEAIHDSYELLGVYLPCVWTSVALPDNLSPAKVYWMRVIRQGGMQMPLACVESFDFASLTSTVLARENKLNKAESVLGKCAFSEDILRWEWDAQIKAQTKPLPCQHKNWGKSAVEEALCLWKSRDVAADYVEDLCHRIIDLSSVPWETATAELELETAMQILRKAKIRLKKKEEALGVMARQQLQHLIKSPFLTKKMNA
ncbi:hypothetical protein BT96DRAFT_1010945 [Gymnopus androsaceus JB14]|uniref:Uncharacterized protein n=1 Tax=Gymnopus androsaceus JB14 TaxID=1447944 RepID=A0A6A4G9Z3_9AGAR|nr:hypothetical protein BT96DRAFT_1010945 [Gymnopus androsaceus JB14]